MTYWIMDMRQGPPRGAACAKAGRRLLRFLCQKCVCSLALFVTLKVSATVVGGEASREYEIEGAIDQACFVSDHCQITMKAQFKVMVQGCQWLIQTVEDKHIIDDIGSRQLEYLKRENGSTNGAEIFDVVTPLKGGIRNATIVSNDIGFGQMDADVVGHLWLMLASGSYFSSLKTNEMTPVYTPMLLTERRLKQKVEWRWLAGPESLPQSVNYFYAGRTGAVYQVTSTTNIEGSLFPTGFVFEAPGKRATAVVTAIRAHCSVTSLLPVVDNGTAVSDRRMLPANPPLKVEYIALRNSGVLTIADARKAYDKKQKLSASAKALPVVQVLLTVVCFLPLAVYGVYLWTHRKKVEK